MLVGTSDSLAELETGAPLDYGQAGPYYSADHWRAYAAGASES